MTSNNEDIASQIVSNDTKTVELTTNYSSKPTSQYENKGLNGYEPKSKCCHIFYVFFKILTIGLTVIHYVFNCHITIFYIWPNFDTMSLSERMCFRYFFFRDFGRF